ncbi:Ferritin-2 [Spatholobus suberectus]|nr:Ferritin-2 [Spatholobus suberectus]
MLDCDVEGISPQIPHSHWIGHEHATRQCSRTNLSPPRVLSSDGPKRNPVLSKFSKCPSPPLLISPLSLPFAARPSEFRAAIDIFFIALLAAYPLQDSFQMAFSCTKASAFSLSPIVGDAPKKLTFSSSVSFVLSSSFSPKVGGHRILRVCAASNAPAPLARVIFEPFEELKRGDLAVPIAQNVSLARQNYADESEAAINEQINVEYNASYVYHSLFAYFDRDDIALKGLAKFFKESSEEEREHAEKLIKYQNIRGGRVVLYPITSPPSEFEHAEKGDALYAMEIALSLEKLVNEKLLHVHSVADCNNDPQLADYIESEFLYEQVKSIKKIAEYVTQLRLVGKGHGMHISLAPVILSLHFTCYWSTSILSCHVSIWSTNKLSCNYYALASPWLLSPSLRERNERRGK